MTQGGVFILLLCLPVILGAGIALLNSPKVNGACDKLEALVRRRDGIVSVKRGFLARWIVRPHLGLLTKLFDGTASIGHPGSKHGVRAAVFLYVFAFWLMFVVYAFACLLYVALGLIFFFVAVWVMCDLLGLRRPPVLPLFNLGRNRTLPKDPGVLAAAGRGGKIYSGTNLMNEELRGRVDQEGNIYSGTNWANEKKIGRINEDGHIFRGTNWMNEERVGRIDDGGNIHKGANWLSDEKVGRVDEGGDVYEGTSWLNERKIGRTEPE